MMLDNAKAIISKRLGRLKQLQPSSIKEILTFVDILPKVGAYTYSSNLRLFDKSDLDYVYIDVAAEDLYPIIAPLMIHASIASCQLEYEECFDINVPDKNISIVINKNKLEEVSVIFNFFGYELTKQHSVSDEPYAIGHPELIQATYQFKEIPC